MLALGSNDIRRCEDDRGIDAADEDQCLAPASLRLVVSPWGFLSCVSATRTRVSARLVASHAARRSADEDWGTEPSMAADL